MEGNTDRGLGAAARHDALEVGRGRALRFDSDARGPAASRAGSSFQVLVEGLDLALHYGWFERPSDAGEALEALRRAQPAFTDQVTRLVPQDARRVLDVGTGRGETARALAGRGATVLTIAPDENQGRWLAAHGHPSVTFRPIRFEDLSTTQGEAFDAVVFSESSNYVALDNLLTHSAALTAPRASLVIAAPFLRSQASRTYDDMHPVQAFRDKAERSEWSICEEHDFTEQVAPTLRIGRLLVEQRVLPLARVLDRSLTTRAPTSVRALWWMLGRHRRRGFALLERTLPALLDEVNFVREVAFLFMRLEKRPR